MLWWTSVYRALLVVYSASGGLSFLRCPRLEVGPSSKVSVFEFELDGEMVTRSIRRETVTA